MSAATRWRTAPPSSRSRAGSVSGTTSPADIERLAGFLRATDWKVIYAVNMAKAATLGAAAGEP